MKANIIDGKLFLLFSLSSNNNSNYLVEARERSNNTITDHRQRKCWIVQFLMSYQVEAKKRLCLRPRSSDAVRISLAYSTSKDHNQMALDEQKHSLSKSSSKFFEEKIGACVHATKNVISRVKLASVTLQVLSKIFLPDPMVDQSSGLRGY